MMQTLTQLPARFQTTFLMNVVELLQKLLVKHKQMAGYGRLLSFKQPTLLADESRIEWRFPYRGGSYDTDDNVVTAIFKLDPHWLSNGQDAAGVLGSSPILSLSSGCNCMEAARLEGPCHHFLGAAQYLVDRLGKASVEESIKWLDKCYVPTTRLGDQLLAHLEDYNSRSLPTEPQRVQWRLCTTSGRYRRDRQLEFRCYVQKQKSNGGWSAGRQIRNYSYNFPAGISLQPHDELMLPLLMFYNSSNNDSGLALKQIFRLCSENPILYWDSTLELVRLREVTPTIRMEEVNGNYRTEVTVAGRPLLEMGWLQGEGDQMLAWHAEPESSPELIYLQLPRRLANSIFRLSRDSENGAKFTPEAAMRISTLFGNSAGPKSLETVLPESLAGPEVPLEPKCELHLMPRKPEGLLAQLRIACEYTDEPPIPGMEPHRLRVFTPAGPLQLIRDLGAESAQAETLIQALNLGNYPYEGPYTWVAESVEAALQLIERSAQQAEHGLTVCWPKSQPMRLLGEITPQSLRIRVSTQRDWFGMEGALKIEGMEVPLAELLAALRRGGRYVQLASGQFAAISDTLRKRLTVIDDVSNTEGKQLRVARAGGGLLQESLGDDIDLTFDAKWQSSIERLTSTAGLPTKPPAGLKAELRDYQLEGYKWLAKLSHWGLGGCLADDMGLGKTVQALGVLLDRAHHGPALVVAPTSVGMNWVRETERFAPSLSAKLYREHNRDALIRDASQGDLIITSYQLLQRDAERFGSRSWSTLVLDESQFIKNFQTKTSQAIRGLNVDWCLAISGTPLENHLGELWGLMRVVSPGLLGSWERFRKRFAEPIEREHDQERLQSLSHVVRPFVLRRTKAEVLTELPPRTEVVLSVELSPAERKKYDAARIAALSDLTAPKDDDNDQKKRIRVLSWLMRLRQLACHVRLVDDKWKKSSAKLDQFMEVIHELRENGHRALVFSQFVQHLGLVREALDKAQIPYQYLDGSTTASKRQTAIDAFQAGEGDLFLISLKAGGTGLNLTEADYVLHLDPWWNPAVEDQATDRAHRIGQTRKVTVYRLVTRDTIEEQILSLHAAKRELMSGLLEGTDSAGKLSTEELVDLIRTNQLLDS